MKKVNYGFTLSEVLITLTILGIIAIAVIPNIVQRYNERVLVVKIKKYYSEISNALVMAQIEQGPATTWDIGDRNTLIGSTKLYNIFKPYLQVVKECDKSCYSYSYKDIDGNELKKAFNQDKTKDFILKNGILMHIYSHGNELCHDPLAENRRCGSIWFDLNGEKGPNIYGVDNFNLPIYINSLSEMGEFRITPSANQKIACGKNKDMYKNNSADSCLLWVIQKSNMDYLRRDISSEW